MANEWYRSRAWDQEARDDFERRLGRARVDMRSQYLRIKAHSIEEVEPAAAERLFERVIREYPDSLDAVSALEHIGDLQAARGQRELAEQTYRALLVKGNGLSPSATSGAINLSLAELLLSIPGREDEVVQELVRVQPSSGTLTMNFHRFRWERALAIVSDRLGEKETSQKAAQRALDLLVAPDQFSRHPGVGRAVASEDQVAQLRRLAAL